MYVWLLKDLKEWLSIVAEDQYSLPEDHFLPECIISIETSQYQHNLCGGKIWLLFLRPHQFLIIIKAIMQSFLGFFFFSISTFFSQFSFTGNRLWYSFILASFDLARIFGLPPSEGKVLIHLSQTESHQNTMFPSKVFIYWVDYFFLIFKFFFYQTN